MTNSRPRMTATDTVSLALPGLRVGTYLANYVVAKRFSEV